MDVCRQTSFKSLLLLQFSLTLTKRAITHKTVEQIFEVLLLKFLANF